jgi:hypothetical protein
VSGRGSRCGPGPGPTLGSLGSVWEIGDEDGRDGGSIREARRDDAAEEAVERWVVGRGERVGRVVCGRVGGADAVPEDILKAEMTRGFGVVELEMAVRTVDIDLPGVCLFVGLSSTNF